MERSHSTVPILLALLTIVATACGTRVDKEAFYRELAAQGGVATEDGAAGTAGGPGEQGAAARSAGGSTRVLGTSTTRPGSESGSGTARPPGIPSHVSTKEIGKVVRVGIHVPVTGAAPLPSNWSDAIEVVEAYTRDHPIHGRTVQFVVEDDGYDAAKGLAACRKLAGEDVVFVIGHTMPTIQDGCAELFEKRGIPYLMRGVPESFLDGRRLSYFGTASDDLQARLLADYALANLGANSKVTAVVSENDQPVSKNVFVSRIKKGGGTVGPVENSVPRQSDFGPIIEKLQQAGAQIVFLNIAPVDAIKIAVQAQGAGYHPTWIGEGTHWNYNLTMESAGTAMDGAITFSPWASIDSAATKGYKDAFRRYKPNATADDLGLIIWGWAMLARGALEDAGPRLSRASFVGAMDGLRFSEPYWHPLSFTASDHRGARSVAVFRGDGQAKRWRQIQGFRASF